MLGQGLEEKRSAYPRMSVIAGGRGRIIVFILSSRSHRDGKRELRSTDRASETANALLAEVKDCRSVLADKSYDSDTLRATIRVKEAKPIIPGRKLRNRVIRFDKTRYKSRWMIEAMFCRLGVLP